VRLEHRFTVPARVDDAWRVLLDLPRVAPCMPGATLTEFDGESFAGTVKVKLGPIMLNYRGTGRFVERDEAARRVVFEASGRDTRAAATASATVTASLAPDGDMTRAEVLTDLTITGRPAQFGRGMLADVSGRLIGQFADCLATTLQETHVLAPADADHRSEDVAPEPNAGRPSDVETSTDAGQPPGSSRGGAPEHIDLLRIATASAVVRRYAWFALAAATVLLAWRVLRRRAARERSAVRSLR
jgi:carbon monoxide dehydrogenase subunit G